EGALAGVEAGRHCVGLRRAAGPEMTGPLELGEAGGGGGGPRLRPGGSRVSRRGGGGAGGRGGRPPPAARGGGGGGAPGRAPPRRPRRPPPGSATRPSGGPAKRRRAAGRRPLPAIRCRPCHTAFEDASPAPTGRTSGEGGSRGTDLDGNVPILCHRGAPATPPRHAAPRARGEGLSPVGL